MEAYRNQMGFYNGKGVPESWRRISQSPVKTPEIIRPPVTPGYEECDSEERDCQMEMPMSPMGEISMRVIPIPPMEMEKPAHPMRTMPEMENLAQPMDTLPDERRASPPDCAFPGACITLAMAYVPMQQWDAIYEADQAMERGTLFPDLDLPFFGKGDCIR